MWGRCSAISSCDLARVAALDDRGDVGIAPGGWRRPCPAPAARRRRPGRGSRSCRGSGEIGGRLAAAGRAVTSVPPPWRRGRRRTRPGRRRGSAAACGCSSGRCRRGARGRSRPAAPAPSSRTVTRRRPPTIDAPSSSRQRPALAPMPWRNAFSTIGCSRKAGTRQASVAGRSRRRRRADRRSAPAADRRSRLVKASSIGHGVTCDGVRSSVARISSLRPSSIFERLVVRADADQRGDRVERVEEEVRLDLEAQRVELGPGDVGLELRLAHREAARAPAEGEHPAGDDHHQRRPGCRRRRAS